MHTGFVIIAPTIKSKILPFKSQTKYCVRYSCGDKIVWDLLIQTTKCLLIDAKASGSRCIHCKLTVSSSS